MRNLPMAIFGFGKKKEVKEQKIALAPDEHFEKAMGGWHKLPVPGGPLELAPGSGYTSFPTPNSCLRFIYESERKFIEETYYWILNFMRYSGLGRVPNAKKVLDTFQGSVQSSSFGQQAQRQGIQQDRASQYLRGISEMTKQLHQLVRDMRILDERLSFYDQTFNDEDIVSADIALKGLWIDMVEGGAKNPASVYGMQQNLSFATLPDLFFATRIKSEKGLDKLSITDYETKTRSILKGIDKEVDKLEFNNKVKEVLKRKLYQFYTWKYRTYRELKQRRTFTIKYLRQHYNTIKLYAEWVKPYLQNVARLSGSQKMQDQPEMVSGFESSILELELLGGTGKKIGPYEGFVSVHLRFVTTPQFSYTTPDFQNRGPQHSGRMEITLRTYGLTKKEVDLYAEMRSREALEYVRDYDHSVSEMLDSVSEDLAEYLKEAGENLETPREKEMREARESDLNKQEAVNPFFMFTEVFGGFKELFGSLGVQNVFLSESASEPNPDDRKKAAAKANGTIYNIYNYYKKSHQFMTP
jgi:hypothetical protein